MNSVQMVHGLGRAKNAVQGYLVHKLLFPKVYLDAEFNGHKVDVLAIDREGTGDVHGVHTFPLTQGTGLRAALVRFASKLDSAVEEIRILPSHYRYVAVVSDDPGAYEFSPSDLISISQKWLADDGVGRTGILYVDLTEEDPKFQVRVILKAERFRSSKEIVDLADQFVAANTPNWEVRE